MTDAFDYAPMLGWGDTEADNYEAATDASVRFEPTPTSAGGANLVEQGAFEQRGPWTVGAGWTVPYAVSDAFHGSAVARLVATASSGPLASNAFVVDPTTKSYFFSFRYRLLAHARGNLRASVRAYNAEGAQIEGDIVIAHIGDDEVVGTDWFERTVHSAPVQEEEDQPSLPLNAVTCRLVFEVVGDTSLTIEVDGVQAVEGSVDAPFDEQPGENIDGTDILPGTLPNTAFDTTPPAALPAPTLITGSRMSADGNIRPYIQATWPQSAESDVAGYELQLDRNADPMLIDFDNPTTVRTAATSHQTEDVEAGLYYAARVAAFDLANNLSAWSPIAYVRAGLDDSAPTVPTNLLTYPGIRLIGVRWDASPEADLDRYEVRWRTVEDPDSEVEGVPGPWTTVATKATGLVITNLLAAETPIDYEIQVRAIDRSGLVRWSATDPLAVLAANNPTAGWSDPVVAAPVLIGQNDIGPDAIVAGMIVAGSILAAHVSAGAIDTDHLRVGAVNADRIAAGSISSGHVSATGIAAEKLTSGTLSIGGLNNAPDYLLIFDANGIEIGRFDVDGFLLKDPQQSLNQIRFKNGKLEFSKTGGFDWGTAIDAEGITADAIRVGVAPGGHNAIPNSSFENTPFVQLVSKVWTLAADWAATIGTNVNLDTSTGDLRMSSVTY